MIETTNIRNEKKRVKKQLLRVSCKENFFSLIKRYTNQMG